MNKEQFERYLEDFALACYAVIAPLVSRLLSAVERVRITAEILSTNHMFPEGRMRRVSRRSLNRWCDFYRHGRKNEQGVVVTEPGLVALRPLPRADRGTPRVVDPALVDRAVELRRELPERTTGTLVELLKSEAREKGLQELGLEEATLAYHLRQRNATKKQLKLEGKAFPRYEHPRRNASWQGDWSQGILLPDPTNPNKTKLCHLHAFICDHSRYVVHAEFYFRQNLPCLEDCFRKAILHGGIPEMAYFDNGAVYQSKQVQRIAGRLQMQVVFATPYCPEGKGKIERWFKTCKESFYPEARRANLQSRNVRSGPGRLGAGQVPSVVAAQSPGAGHAGLSPGGRLAGRCHGAIDKRIKTVAGGVVMATQVGQLPGIPDVVSADPMLTWGAGLIAGGGVAAAVHAGSATLRAGSSAISGGLLSPLYGLAESIASVVASILAFVVPVLFAVAFGVIAFILLGGIIWWFRSRSSVSPTKRLGYHSTCDASRATRRECGRRTALSS